MLNNLKKYYYRFMYYNCLSSYLKRLIDVKIPISNTPFNNKWRYISIISVNLRERYVTVQYAKTKEFNTVHYYNIHLKTVILNFDEINNILYTQAIYNNHSAFSTTRDKYMLIEYYRVNYNKYTI